MTRNHNRKGGSPMKKTLEYTMSAATVDVKEAKAKPTKKK